MRGLICSRAVIRSNCIAPMTKKVVKGLIGVLVVGLIDFPTIVKAQPASPPVIIANECTITGPGVALCAGILLADNELKNFLNGKKAVGPNGEIVKAGKVVWHDATKGPGPRNDIVGRKG